MNPANFMLKILHKPMGVPYMREHDGKSHSYIDLKRCPERIGDIPEVKDWPEIEHVLRRINSRNSAFHTIGCERCLEQAAGGTWSLVGYVGFAFDSLALAENSVNYFVVFQSFSNYFKEHALSGGISVSYEIVPTHFIDRGAGGWSADWWMQALAETSDVCRVNWAAALDVFGQHLLRISPSFG